MQKENKNNSRKYLTKVQRNDIIKVQRKEREVQEMKSRTELCELRNAYASKFNDERVKPQNYIHVTQGYMMRVTTYTCIHITRWLQCIVNQIILFIGSVDFQQQPINICESLETGVGKIINYVSNRGI